MKEKHRVVSFRGSATADGIEYGYLLKRLLYGARLTFSHHMALAVLIGWLDVRAQGNLDQGRHYLGTGASRAVRGRFAYSAWQPLQ